MTLSIFLAIGESWEDFCSKGQDKLWLNNNLKYYAANFLKVNVFSYGTAQKDLLPNVKLYANKYHLPRFIYALILPFLFRNEIKKTDIIRGMQLTGGIPAVTTKIFFNKKIVINYGYDYQQTALVEGKPIRSLGYKLLGYLILPFVNKIIITNLHIWEKIKFVNKRKIKYIPNGVNSKVFRPIKSVKIYDVLYVGRLEKQKNLFMLLDAVSKISPELKLLFIGSGSLKEQIITKAKALHLDLKIIDLIANDQLPKYYNQTKIFVFPSLIEGHPKALLEAMSCGLPVIGTNVEGIKDIITNEVNGLLVNKQVDDLTMAMKALLLSSKLGNRLGSMARNTIISKYDSDSTWTKEIKLLQNLK